MNCLHHFYHDRQSHFCGMVHAHAVTFSISTAIPKPRSICISLGRLGTNDSVMPSETSDQCHELKVLPASLPEAGICCWMPQGGNDNVGTASDGTSPSVGQSNTSAVREDKEAATVHDRSEGASDTGAVAGEVRGHEGVASGAAAGDARAGLKEAANGGNPLFNCLLPQISSPSTPDRHRAKPVPARVSGCGDDGDDVFLLFI